MKTLNTIWASGLLCVVLASGVQAQDARIAFINSQRITSESGPAKAATAKLESEFSKRQKELTDLQSSLKTFSEKFERDAPTMTESQRAAK